MRWTNTADLLLKSGRYLGFASLVLAGAVLVGMQAPSSTNRPVFEVASIKVNKASGGPVGGSCHGVDSSGRDNNPGNPIPLGRCVYRKTQLKWLIVSAFSIRLLPEVIDRALVGMPSWASSEIYDVEAKASSPGATEADLRLMLQTMLADRFKFQMHRETRDTPGLGLVVARSGAKLKTTTLPRNRQNRYDFNGDTLTGRGLNMNLLAEVLSAKLGQPVVNRTAIDGNFDFTLTWTPAEGELPSVGPPPPPVPGGGRPVPKPTDPTGPTIFTAIQEQLGLRLESMRVPMEVFVIDRVERPTPNSAGR